MQPRFIGPIALWHHTPKERAHARILLVHGISEHSGRHLNTVEHLVRSGYEVVRFDLRGMGQSSGQRQWISSFEDYVRDTIDVHNWICRELEPLPLFVLGHSLGGAISIWFTAHYAPVLEGLVLSAPAYRVGTAYSKFTLAVGRVAAKIFPKFPLKKTGMPWGISRDKEVVRAFMEDPLSCHSNTLQQGQEVLDAFERLPALCASIQIPTVIFHGTSDQIILAEGSYFLLEALRAGDKELHFLPAGYHEPHNDIDKEQYFSELSQWLERHRPQSEEANAPRPKKRAKRDEEAAPRPSSSKTTAPS